MVELIVKFLVAGAVLSSGAMLGKPDFDLAMKCAAALGAVAYFSHVLDERGLRNPGVAGFLAVTESIAIAFALQGAGMLDSLGFLVLAPCAYAASKSGAMPIAMAPIAVAGLFGAHLAMATKPEFSNALMLHGAGVLVVGLLLNGPIRVQRGDSAPTVQNPVSEGIPIEPELEQALALRETYRQLREAYSDLEGKAKRDRIVAELAELKEGPPAGFPRRVIGRVAEWTGATGVTLYTVAQYAGVMVVRASNDPGRESDHPIEIDVRQAPAQVKSSLERSLAVRMPGVEFINVVLPLNGRMVGMLTIADPDPRRLERARLMLEDAAGALAAAIQQEARRETFERRLRESETLYNVAALADGAGSRTHVADRVVRELFPTMDLCHLGVTLVEGNEALLLANEGTAVRLIEKMSFSRGPGLGGWLDTGAPELLLFDVRSDSRCPQAEALKVRIGSYFVIPLTQEERPIGYLSAAADRAGGLDIAQVETLRVVAAELGRTLQRIDSNRIDPEGILTPKQLQERIAGTDGHLVVLEVLRREQILEAFGRPAVGHALRTFTKRIRARLPLGGAVCRKSDTEIVVFLPGLSEMQATSWANEMAASASMIGLRTPDGAAPMPLAFRAKVAAIRPQKNQISA